MVNECCVCEPQVVSTGPLNQENMVQDKNSIKSSSMNFSQFCFVKVDAVKCDVGIYITNLRNIPESNTCILTL